MNKHILLRILCGLTFLIFLCPFFQMCSDRQLKNGKQIATWDNRIQRLDSTYIPTKREEDSIIKRVNDSLFLGRKKESTFSGYGLVGNVYRKSHFDYTSVAFIIIIICSALQLVYVYRKQYKKIWILGIVNIIMAILYLGFMVWIEFLEEITQIKYGYYLFIINTFAITLLSKKLTNHGI